MRKVITLLENSSVMELFRLSSSVTEKALLQDLHVLERNKIVRESWLHKEACNRPAFIVQRKIHHRVYSLSQRPH